MENDVAYQLVPPHCHICNTAERAIHTFKEHFVSGLAYMYPDFPMHLWDRLLHQAAKTLNLLRTSILYPQLSAAVRLYGPVDYNKTSFAPPGCNIIAHEKPNQRQTWAPHGKHEYSLGPVMQHYWCQSVYITSSNATSILHRQTLHGHPGNELCIEAPSP
jgi:hypothetical protein